MMSSPTFENFGIRNPSVDIDFGKILPRQSLTGAQLTTRLDAICNPLGIVTTRLESAVVPTYEGQSRGLAIRGTVAAHFLVLTFNRNSVVGVRMYLEADMIGDNNALYIANADPSTGANQGNHLGYQTSVPNIVFQKNTGIGYTALYTKALAASSATRTIRMFMELNSPKGFFRLDTSGALGHHTGGMQFAGSTQTAVNPNYVSVQVSSIPNTSAFQFWLKRLQIQFVSGSAYS